MAAAAARTSKEAASEACKLDSCSLQAWTGTADWSAGACASIMLAAAAAGTSSGKAGGEEGVGSGGGGADGRGTAGDADGTA